MHTQHMNLSVAVTVDSPLTSLLSVLHVPLHRTLSLYPPFYFRPTRPRARMNCSSRSRARTSTASPTTPSTISASTNTTPPCPGTVHTSRGTSTKSGPHVQLAPARRPPARRALRPTLRSRCTHRVCLGASLTTRVHLATKPTRADASNLECTCTRTDGLDGLESLEAEFTLWYTVVLGVSLALAMAVAVFSSGEHLVARRPSASQLSVLARHELVTNWLHGRRCLLPGWVTR